MEPNYEKIDENTIKVTKALPPEETVLDLPTLEAEKENVQRQMADIQSRADSEIRIRLDRITEIDFILAKAVELTEK